MADSMTKERFIELIDGEDSEEEFLAFGRIAEKFSSRPDLHAFLLMDRLVPSHTESDLLSAAEHDEIWIEIEIERLVEAGITVEQVRDLVRCGVRYDSNHDSLAMFV
jgi:hypothetical protein